MNLTVVLVVEGRDVAKTPLVVEDWGLETVLLDGVGALNVVAHEVVLELLVQVTDPAALLSAIAASDLVNLVLELLKS